MLDKRIGARSGWQTCGLSAARHSGSVSRNFRRIGLDIMAATSALRRTSLLALPLLIASLLLPARGAAQTEVTAGLRGRVTVESNRAAPAGARVCVRNRALRVEREATTDEVGAYAISGLPPGDAYEVTVSANNFRTMTRTQLKLSSGQSLNLALALALVGVAETVEITDAAA